MWSTESSEEHESSEIPEVSVLLVDNDAVGVLVDLEDPDEFFSW